jgi:hypothetical protein
VARIEQIVFVVDFFDVHVVAIVPVAGPRVRIDEPVAAIVKPAVVAALDVEVMFAPEAGTIFFLGNAAGVATIFVTTGVAIGMLFSLARALLVRGAILLRGSLLVTIALFLLLLGAIVLLRGSGMVCGTAVRFLPGSFRWRRLVLFALAIFPLFRFFVLFGLFLRFVFIWFLRVSRCPCKQNR